MSRRTETKEVQKIEEVTVGITICDCCGKTHEVEPDVGFFALPDRWGQFGVSGGLGRVRYDFCPVCAQKIKSEYVNVKESEG